MSDANPTIDVFACGPSRGKCVCRCGHKPGKCALPIMECLQSDHWVRDCGHDFTGPEWRSEDGCTSSVTCRHCGMTALHHDMWVGP